MIEMGTYAAQSPNMKNASVRRVNQDPHRPRSPRFHAFHFSRRFSLNFSRFPALVMSLISSALHSGPRAGTVTISTGPIVLGASSFGVCGIW